ncbi:MAG: sigma-54-dependent Fis family transcriptional regulator [Verrucomicrobiaceae bacterium]|nr:sigma-54-dependent Fis family transcriptional regulator [Verrucomicrobiaceae bacterium]
MKKKLEILVVDDEPDIRELLEITIGRMGLKTASAESVQDAIALLSKREFALCLTDMKLPDGSGMDVIQYIQREIPQLPVAMITAFGNVETAIGALKAGAFDFIAKPIDLERLRSLIQSCLRLEDSSEPVGYNNTAQLIGNTPIMKELRKQIQKMARSQAPIYISGESGSGKEVVARLIHANGPRASGAFIPVNCGAIPNELMESEFFGHVKGSFTGAHEDKKGLFEAAHGGTLFLDEVADLPLAMQVKLLRAIQEKSVRKVGSNQEVSVDVRLLSATHKNLKLEMEEKRFRGDLFYRINVIEIHVPSLRERTDDIPLLADKILRQLADEWQLPKPTLSDDAYDTLQSHDFPGNVRELENILERAFTLCESEQITSDDLQLPQLETSTTNFTAIENTSVDFSGFESLEKYLEYVEKDILQRVLDQHRWNRTAAAKSLGMTFRQLRYRLQKLGLDGDGAE